MFVGALRFPAENLILSRRLANFVEVYGSQRPVSDIPNVVVTFGNLTVNGRPVEKPSAEAVYPPGVPDYAEAVAKDNKVVITVGRPVEQRAERRVELIGR